MAADIDSMWLTIDEAYPLLRRHFRTRAAFKHHCVKRAKNGLEAMGAVRLSPLRRLLVKPDLVRAWATGSREAA